MTMSIEFLNQRGRLMRRTPLEVYHANIKKKKEVEGNILENLDGSMKAMHYGSKNGCSKNENVEDMEELQYAKRLDKKRIHGD